MVGAQQCTVPAGDMRATQAVALHAAQLLWSRVLKLEQLCLVDRPKFCALNAALVPRPAPPLPRLHIR